MSQVMQPVPRDLRASATAALVALLLGALSQQLSIVPLSTSSGDLNPLAPPATAAVGPSSLPLSFERNVGQTDEHVRYVARLEGAAAFLTSHHLVIGAADPDSLRIGFPGSDRSAAPTGENALPGDANYLIGNDRSEWYSHVPTFRTVRYDDIYPGIDLVYHGIGGQLEYDFVVHPGADPADIAISAGGAELELESGSLVARADNGRFVQERPVAYQIEGGARVPVTADYRLASTKRAAIEVGAYDRDRTLVIDPVLVYSTFLGGPASNDPAIRGSGSDFARGVAVGADGSAYVVGTTFSYDFPTKNPIQATNKTDTASGYNEGFVSKLSPDGSQLVYSTYLGGFDVDELWSVAVDSDGSAYVVGAVHSSGYPVEAPYQAQVNGRVDGVLSKLSPDGSDLVYSTYIGGGREDAAYAVAVDPEEHAYVVGRTQGGFPEADRSKIQPVFGGADYDAFVVKFSADGQRLEYSSYLGGSGYDVAYGVATAPTGSVFITGRTDSTDFLLANQAYPDLVGSDAFLSKIDSVGSRLEFSTYFGGNHFDMAHGVALGPDGDPYVAGVTFSSDFPIPRPELAPQPLDLNGSFQDAYAARFEADGSEITYGTYIGGTGIDVAYGIAVDPFGSVYVAGTTESDSFPGVKTSSIQQANSGGVDAFLEKLTPGDKGAAWMTFLGGSSTESGLSLENPPVEVAAGLDGSAYVAGHTDSPDFPVRDAYQDHLKPAHDAFVVRIAPDPALVQLMPNKLPVWDICLAPPPSCSSDVLSDKFDGLDVRAHLVVVAPAETTTVSWYACPRGVSFFGNFELNSCSTFIGTDAEGGGPPDGTSGAVGDRTFETWWDIPGSLDRARRDIVAIACTGTGERLEGPNPNCVASVEDSVFLEDASDGSPTALNQTSSGDIGPYRTLPSCLGSAQAVCDVAYKPFASGSFVPNEGFDFRAFTSDDVNAVNWAINAVVGSTAKPSGSNFISSSGCVLERTFTDFKRWRCEVFSAAVPDDSPLSISLLDLNAPGGQPEGTGGYCNGNNAAPSRDRNGVDGAHDTCVLDVLYALSSERLPGAIALTRVQSVKSVASVPCPPTTATLRGRIGRPERLSVCLSDRFGDPLNAPWTITALGQGRIQDCGTARPEDHPGGRALDHCHGTTGASGLFSSVGLAASKFGSQIVIGCLDPESDLPGHLGHGCADAGAPLRQRLVIRWASP